MGNTVPKKRMLFQNDNSCFYRMLFWGGHLCACAGAHLWAAFAIPAAQMPSPEFLRFIHRREHGGRREVVVRRLKAWPLLRIRCSPRPRFTQIFFNPEKRELRQRFLHSCIPYLICGNLRNLRISQSLCSEIFSHGLTQMGTDSFESGKQESSKWDFRDRRKSCEGSSERVGVTSEFQIMKWSPASRVLAFLIQSSPRACCSVRCPQRIGLCVAVLVSSTDAGVWHKARSGDARD